MYYINQFNYHSTLTFLGRKHKSTLTFLGCKLRYICEISTLLANTLYLIICKFTIQLLILSIYFFSLKYNQLIVSFILPTFEPQYKIIGFTTK